MSHKRGPYRLVPYFASLDLDRAPELRENPVRISLLAHHTETRFIAFWRGRHLITRNGRTLARLKLTDFGDRAHDLEGLSKPFLGRNRNGPVFGIDLSPLSIPPLPDGYIFTELGPQNFLLNHDDAALAAALRGLADWNRDTSVPRVDLMAVAMPVTAERVLLARSRDTAGRVLTCLPAAVEPGEMVEQAATRELALNFGLRAKRLQYYASQPWPFPSMMLMGFHVLIKDPELVVHDRRIADARWFTREEIFAHRDLGFDLPDHRTLAGRMLQRWVKCCDMFGKENPTMSYPSGYVPAPQPHIGQKTDALNA